MIVCIDTNVLLQAVNPDHHFHTIFDGWFQRRFRWAVSNDVLMEYEEIITRQSGRHRWLQFVHILDLAEARGHLIMSVAPSYHFHIVADDPDDNKFIDCAITADADYVITEDKHFSPLADAGYKSLPITPQEFIRRHLGSG